jgi:hypothetical protein
MGKEFGCFTQTSRFFGKAFFERYGLLEPTTFHGGPPLS